MLVVVRQSVRGGQRSPVVVVVGVVAVVNGFTARAVITMFTDVCVIVAAVPAVMSFVCSFLALFFELL